MVSSSSFACRARTPTHAVHATRTTRIALITILVALAGVLVVRRLRGRVVAARSAMGVGGVAVFLLCFWLFDGGGPVVNVIGGLIGLSAVSAGLFASFWD